MVSLDVVHIGRLTETHDEKVEIKPHGWGNQAIGLFFIFLNHISTKTIISAMNSDRELVALLIESYDSNKIFESKLIPREYKSIYQQTTNQEVKKHIQELTLRACRMIESTQSLLKIVSYCAIKFEVDESYIAICRNYPLAQHFNDFLVYAAKNKMIIPPNAPYALPLKIIFGIMMAIAENRKFEKTAEEQSSHDDENSMKEDHMKSVMQMINGLELKTRGQPENDPVVDSAEHPTIDDQIASKLVDLAEDVSNKSNKTPQQKQKSKSISDLNVFLSSPLEIAA